MTETRETIDDVARELGWSGDYSLNAFLRHLGRDLEQERSVNETHRLQERRLKSELAEARAETHVMRRAYQQQHDVWEELYVKEGIERLRARAEAYDGVWAQLQHLVEAAKLSSEEHAAVLSVGRSAVEKKQRRDLVRQALLRITSAVRLCQTKHLEPSVGEMTFAQRLEYFAKEALKAPEHGAVSSRGQLSFPANLERARRDSEALFGLLESLCTLPAGFIQAHTVREAARRAWLVIAGGK